MHLENSFDQARNLMQFANLKKQKYLGHMNFEINQGLFLAKFSLAIQSYWSLFKIA